MLIWNKSKTNLDHFFLLFSFFICDLLSIVHKYHKLNDKFIKNISFCQITTFFPLTNSKLL